MFGIQKPCIAKVQLISGFSILNRPFFSMTAFCTVLAVLIRLTFYIIPSYLVFSLNIFNCQFVIILNFFSVCLFTFFLYKNGAKKKKITQTFAQSAGSKFCAGRFLAFSTLKILYQQILARSKFWADSYYISRIQNSASSALQTGLYKVVTAWKTFLQREVLIRKK